MPGPEYTLTLSMSRPTRGQRRTCISENRETHFLHKQRASLPQTSSGFHRRNLMRILAGLGLIGRHAGEKINK